MFPGKPGKPGLDVESVRSSIARRLGVDIGAVAPVDRYVEGMVEMVPDATAAPLTASGAIANRPYLSRNDSGYLMAIVNQSILV
ncbi:MAG: DUF4172 domain-containing protein [Azoarcus sp.]|jgi:hypothetical protein|nr:DUF4172 domain-containing protein [Azoarcus sp.]